MMKDIVPLSGKAIFAQVSKTNLIDVANSGKPKELAAYDDYDIWLGAIASDVPLNMINSSGHT